MLKTHTPRSWCQTGGLGHGRGKAVRRRTERRGHRVWGGASRVPGAVPPRPPPQFPLRRPPKGARSWHPCLPRPTPKASVPSLSLPLPSPLTVLFSLQQSKFLTPIGQTTVPSTPAPHHTLPFPSSSQYLRDAPGSNLQLLASCRGCKSPTAPRSEQQVDTVILRGRNSD